MKSINAITKWILGAAMAGALVLAAPHKADAQVSFGVRVGAAPVAYGYYGPRYQNWRYHAYNGFYGPQPWQPVIIAPYHYNRWDRYHGRYGWRRF